MQTEMARMLALLNGGEVARRLKVSRAAVSEWARSDDPPPLRVTQVRALLREALEGHQSRPESPQDVRDLLAREVHRILRESGWTQEVAAQAMDVTREQVARWSSTGRIPLHRLATLSERSGIPVALAFGPQEEEPPPWAKALDDSLGAMKAMVETVVERQAGALSAIAELRGLLPPQPSDSEDGQASQPQDDTLGQ